MKIKTVITNRLDCKHTKHRLFKALKTKEMDGAFLNTSNPTPSRMIYSRQKYFASDQEQVHVCASDSDNFDEDESSLEKLGNKVKLDPVIGWRECDANE